jgi:hypothetical protein
MTIRKITRLEPIGTRLIENSDWSIHTPDMGGPLATDTLLKYLGRDWCDIHGMYEHKFKKVNNAVLN